MLALAAAMEAWCAAARALERAIAAAPRWRRRCLAPGEEKVEALAVYHFKFGCDFDEEKRLSAISQVD